MSHLFAVLIRAALPLAATFALIGVAPPVAHAATPSVWGWVTVRKPTTASYTPAPKDQGSSVGGINTVVRSGTGTYVVTFGGLDANSACPVTNTNGCDGHLQVTALAPVA